MRGTVARIWLIGVSWLIFLVGPLPAAWGADVLRATLKNGLRVVIVRNALAPVVTTQVNYLVGSNEAPAGFPGTAHALEHMMFRGSPGLSAAQLSTIAAAMGGDFNADTQQAVTQYFFSVPAEELDIALRIESIRMRGVLSTEKIWRLERGAIEQEVAQDLSNPQYVFYSKLLEAMYAGTPYAHDALGTRESFDRTTGAMLRNFHTTWYAPNNAILVIVGDVEPDRTLETVKRLFEGIPRRPLPPRPAVQVPALSPKTITLDTDLPYGLAVVAYRLPGYDNPDLAAGQVLADVLDSRRGNLYALVPEGKALFTGFDGSALPKAAMGYATAAFPPGGDGSALIGRIKGIIADYVTNGIPEDLVEAAKRHEIADAEFEKNSVTGLANAWSQALAVEGRMSPDDDIEAIKKVTAADVNRVAREYLVNDTATMAVLTPRPSGAPVAAEGFRRAAESFAPKQTKPVPLPAWARKAVAPPAAPTSTVNPIVTVLRNGLRLIVQPETISRTASVYGRIKTNPDLQAPDGKEGLAEVLDGLFSYGTTRLGRLAFQEAQDEIGARVSAGTSFSLQVPEDQFDRGVQLLAENLLSPALPDEAFTVVQQETESAVAGQLQSPVHLARRAIRAALYPKGDPALRQPTPESVRTLSLHDVKAYYHQVFRPDMTTIVVIGQVTPEKAKATIEKYFGDWTATGPKPDTDLPTVPPNPPAASVVPDASRVQDEVTLAQTLGLTRSHPDYYALRVGNQVLSGAAFASRLFRDLREQSGLVYSVDSQLNAGKNRSIFAVLYACDPPNVSKARGMVERDLRDMQNTPISPSELTQAKTLLIRRIPLSTSSTDSIAAELLDLSVRDLPLDEPLRAARRFLQTTAAEVQAAFAKWIRPGDFVQVTLGPKPE
jgi:zinc protease